MSELFKIIGISLSAVVGVAAFLIAVVWIAYTMSTSHGHYLITQENGISFEAIRITCNSNTSLTYTKPDGTTGAIYGNFKVEQIETPESNHK